MIKKKNIFPKLKSKLKWFLTDESGKISKKDALGLSVWGILLSGVDDVLAGHSNITCLASAGIEVINHCNNTLWDYSVNKTITVDNRTSDTWISPGWGTWWHWSAAAAGKQVASCYEFPSVNHSSGIVNWHYSWVFWIEKTVTAPAHSWDNCTAWHNSHGSHGSHCSSKVCW